MSEAAQELRRISWGECFAFTQIFRSFRLACHPTKLILAFSGVLATYATGRVLDAAWISSCQPALSADGQLSELGFFVGCPVRARQTTVDWTTTLGKPDEVRRAGVFRVLLHHGRSTANELASAALALDLARLWAALTAGFGAIAWLAIMHPGYGLIFGLATLAIWALFGGAVARVAALHATRDEKIGARDALAFARTKFFSFLASPLMPLLAVAFIGLILFLGGLVAVIPGIGEVLVALFFILVLIAGFIIAFLTIGAVAGFPLTFPTIAVEGSDAFDALSRTISYVYQRPWRTAFYSAVTLAYGSACFLFVKFFARVVLWSVHLFMGISMNWFGAYVTAPSGSIHQSSGKLDALWQAPSLLGGTPFIGTFNETNVAHLSWFAQWLLKGWIYLFWGLVAAFLVSFFYSASTLIYLLLRREVDATDLEEVYVEEPPEAPVAAPAPPGPAGTSLPVVN